MTVTRRNALSSRLVREHDTRLDLGLQNAEHVHTLGSESPRFAALRVGDGDIALQLQKAVPGQYVASLTGTGKSWLACALGHKACREGFSVLYKRAPRLFADLAQARGEGRIARFLTTIERSQLLIIDDWGPEVLNAEQRRDLLEIVDDRCDKSSLLITSQVPIKQWHDIVGDPTIADAILDRIIHNTHRIELKGHSMRRRQTIQASEERHPAV